LKKLHGFLLVMTLVAVWSAAASAGVSSERKFLICQAGGVTTAADAKPYIDSFGEYLAGRLGWGPDSYEVRFETGSCLEALETWKPGYATIPLWDFLAAESRLNLGPLVFARVRGGTTTTYRILVRKGAYPSLKALRGKVLTGNMVADAVYLSNVVFKGAVDAAGHFVLKQKRRPLRAIRKVARGKADAALVDSLQFESLRELSVYKKLEVIFTSAPVPNLGLVYVKGAVGDSGMAAFRDALIEMCGDPRGAEICRNFALEGFVSVDSKALAAVRALYGGAR